MIYKKNMKVLSKLGNVYNGYLDFLVTVNLEPLSDKERNIFELIGSTAMKKLTMLIIHQITNGPQN